jgi:hypothetical protein
MDKLTRDELDDWVRQIAEMPREQVIELFRTYPAPFPIDFSDAFLRQQTTDKLRHVLAGLVMHCRKRPMLAAA